MPGESGAIGPVGDPARSEPSSEMVVWACAAQATPSAAPEAAQAAPAPAGAAGAAGAAAPAGPAEGDSSAPAAASRTLASADGATTEPPADTRGLDEEIQNEDRRAALTKSPSPSAFPFQLRAISTPLDGRPGLTSLVAAVETGMMTFRENSSQQTYDGEVTVLARVKAKDGETVVFSFVEWPDKATRDAAWPKIMEDSRMKYEGDKMPFDGQRMFWGGFRPILDA